MESPEECTHEGSRVILEVTGGTRQVAALKKGGTLKLLRRTLSVDPLIGVPFGSIFELIGSHLVRVSDENLLLEALHAEEEDGPMIGDVSSRDGSPRMLTPEEIRDLRKEGAARPEIVQRALEGRDTYAGKNEHTQDKYVRRIAQRHTPRVHVIRPTAFDLVRTYSARSPGKICGLRVDTFAMLLNGAQLCPGSTVVVVDEGVGLVAAEVARRVIYSRKVGEEGEDESVFGKVIVLWQRGPRMEGFHLLSIPGEHAKRGVVHSTLAEIVQLELGVERQKKTEEAGSVHSMLQDGVDAVVCCLGETRGEPLDPSSLLQLLLGFLRLSRPFACYFPLFEPLARAQSDLRTGGRFKCVRMALKEALYREYQVLPGRTHPFMGQMGADGWVLVGTTTESSAVVTSLTPSVKRRKVAE